MRIEDVDDGSGGNGSYELTEVHVQFCSAAAAAHKVRCFERLANVEAKLRKD